MRSGSVFFLLALAFGSESLAETTGWGRLASLSLGWQYETTGVYGACSKATAGISDEISRNPDYSGLNVR